MTALERLFARIERDRARRRLEADRLERAESYAAMNTPLPWERTLELEQERRAEHVVRDAMRHLERSERPRWHVRLCRCLFAPDTTAVEAVASTLAPTYRALMGMPPLTDHRRRFHLPEGGHDADRR